MKTQTYKEQILGNTLIAMLIATLGACGAGSLTNEDVTNTAATALDEGSDSLFEGVQSNTYSGTDYQPESFSRTRTCSVTNGVATVEIDTSGSLSNQLTLGNIVKSWSSTFTGTETRAWTPPTGQTITCASNNGWVDINWANSAVVTGLSLNVNVSRSRDTNLSITKAGVTRTRELNSAMTGTRAISFEGETTSGSDLIITKQVSMNVTRSRSVTKLNGSTSQFSANIQTEASAPLVVEVTRDSTSFAALQKKIDSGTLDITRDSSKLVLSFDNVVFDLSSSTHACIPQSGTVSGSFFKDATSATATSTFTVNFSSGAFPTVQFAGGGGSFDLDLDNGCDLGNLN